MFGVGNVTGLGIWLWLSPVIIVGLRIGLDRESVEILVVLRYCVDGYSTKWFRIFHVGLGNC